MATTYPIIRLSILGETVTFRGEDVIEAESTQEIHPISIEVPASTARVRVWLDDTVEDENGKTLRDKFMPFKDGIYYQALSSGLLIDIYEMVDGDTESAVYVGRFYLDSWKNPTEGEIEFECVDAITLLDGIQYLGKFYETETPVTTVLNEIFNYSNLSYVIDDAVAGRTVSGYLSGNTTVREALQQVLFAVGAYACTAGGTDVQIRDSQFPIPGAVLEGYYFDQAGTLFDTALFSDQITGQIVPDSEKTDKQSLTIQRPVTDIEIVSHDYTKSETIETIFQSDWLAPGTYTVVYPKPYWLVRASGVGDRIVYLAAADGTLLARPDSGVYPNVTIFSTYGQFEFGANYVQLIVTSPGGAVLVEGYPYIDNTQSFLVHIEPPQGTPKNKWKIEDALLVNSLTAQSVLQRVADYAILNYTKSVTMFPRTDNLLGEIKTFASLYGKEVVGGIEKVISNLTGGYLLDAEVVGIERNVN